MYFPASGWLVAFLLTVAVEAPIAWYLLRAAEPEGLRLAALVVFANLASHPIVWYVLTQPFLVGTWEYILVAEGWAVAAEAVFYAVAIRGVSPRRAVAVAVLANAASYLAGWVVGGLWPGVFG
jgi:hypothetical protein